MAFALSNFFESMEGDFLRVLGLGASAMDAVFGLLFWLFVVMKIAGLKDIER